jgi:transcriptional regulator with XRE-family HTH domain
VVAFQAIADSRTEEASVYVLMNKERIEELREAKGLSKRALAGAAGIAASTVARAERERPVTFSTGRKVAGALGVGPSPSLGRVLRNAQAGTGPQPLRAQRLSRGGEMDEQQRRERELDALELIAAELEKLRVLKEHELGVTLEHDPDGSGPYVPNVEA